MIFKILIITTIGLVFKGTAGKRSGKFSLRLTDDDDPPGPINTESLSEVIPVGRFLFPLTGTHYGIAGLGNLSITTVNPPVRPVFNLLRNTVNVFERLVIDYTTKLKNFSNGVIHNVRQFGQDVKNKMKGVAVVSTVTPVGIVEPMFTSTPAGTVLPGFPSAPVPIGYPVTSRPPPSGSLPTFPPKPQLPTVRPTATQGPQGIISLAVPTVAHGQTPFATSYPTYHPDIPDKPGVFLTPNPSDEILPGQDY